MSQINVASRSEMIDKALNEEKTLLEINRELRSLNMKPLSKKQFTQKLSTIKKKGNYEIEYTQKFAGKFDNKTFSLKKYGVKNCVKEWFELKLLIDKCYRISEMMDARIKPIPLLKTQLHTATVSQNDDAMFLIQTEIDRLVREYDALSSQLNALTDNYAINELIEPSN
jgi:hypothetical protein